MVRMEDREVWCAAVQGVSKNRTRVRLVTEEQHGFCRDRTGELNGDAVEAITPSSI